MFINYVYESYFTGNLFNPYLPGSSQSNMWGVFMMERSSLSQSPSQPVKVNLVALTVTGELSPSVQM